MIEIRAKIARGSDAAVAGRIELPFERRQKRWLRAPLASGEEVSLRLPRGVILRGGDLLAASDGRVIEVVAVPERLVHVECATPDQLARLAYHLGNRHVPVHIGAGFLRLIEDPVLEDMLCGQGAKITHIEAPFEPEAGGYAGAHHRETDEERNQDKKIHEYGGVSGNRRR
jgi:urease accessory protein